MKNTTSQIYSAAKAHLKNQANRLCIKYLLGSLFVMLFLCGCEKTVEVGLPEHSVIFETVFKDQGSANSAIAGMYGNLYTITNTYAYSISLLNGLLADEMIYNGTTWDQYKNNSLLSNESNVAAVWADSYAAIYRANAIIEGIAASDFPGAFKDQATGEALFIRAFCHFYLVNLYGDVPLITTTKVQDNQLKPRTPSAQVYTQIISDLENAETLLPLAYPSGANRTRVNKYAAAAMLARVYLYQNEYAKAEAKASEVIAVAGGSASVYTLLQDLATVFLVSSTESIWSFDTSVYGYTWVGAQTVPNSGVVPNYILLPGLLNAFETNDKRKASWVATSGGQAYPYKYHTKTNVKQEYDVVLRLAEQYLIRAEARAQQNNLTGAQDDINLIRARAGLGNVSLTATNALQAIAQERRVELFSEWGHRWLDLKRTNQVDAVIGVLKPGLWQSTDALYPIPNVEISKNTNLIQNAGYF